MSRTSQPLLRSRTQRSRHGEVSFEFYIIFYFFFVIGSDVVGIPLRVYGDGTTEVVSSLPSILSLTDRQLSTDNEYVA